MDEALRHIQSLAADEQPGTDHELRSCRGCGHARFTHPRRTATTHCLACKCRKFRERRFDWRPTERRNLIAIGAVFLGVVAAGMTLAAFGVLWLCGVPR